MKERIRKVISKITGLYTFGDFVYKAKMHRQQAEVKIPKVDLLPEHVKDAELLTNREALINRMPSNSVCCEIGVNKGDFSQLLLNICRPKKLHLIDAWGDSARYHDGLKQQVKEKFAGEIGSGQVELNVGLSTEVLLKFPDHYFDWVYLDTDHSYELTSKELTLLENKVKPAGIIAGHDYIMGNWVGQVRYGVMEAVHEFCASRNWKLKYLTTNIAESPSFAIERIAR